MQRNKIASGILAATMFVTTLAFATGGAEAKGGPGKKGAAAKAGKKGGDARLLERYADQLGLTSDQKTRLARVMASVKTERERVKNNASLSPDTKRAKMKLVARNASAQVKAILTPAQEAKIKELRRAARENRTAKVGGASGKNKPTRGATVKG